MTRRLTAVAGIAASALAVAAVATAAPAAARTADSSTAQPAQTGQSLATSVVHVKLSSGTHVKFDLFAETGSSAPQALLAHDRGGVSPRHARLALRQRARAAEAADSLVEVDMGTKHESHSWALAVTSSALSGPSGSTPGALHTGREIQPYGHLSLTLTPSAQATKHSCGASAYFTTQPVVVSGTVSFWTLSGHKHWGHLVKHGFRFSHGNTVETDYGDTDDNCFYFPIGSSSGSLGGPEHAPCRTTVTWFVGGDTSLASGGYVVKHGTLHGFVSALQIVTSHGAMRLDSLDNIKTAAPILFSPDEEHATLTVPGNHKTTVGTLTLGSKPDGQFDTSKCHSDHHAKLHEIDWDAKVSKDSPVYAIREKVGHEVKVRHGVAEIDDVQRV